MDKSVHPVEMEFCNNLGARRVAQNGCEVLASMMILMIEFASLDQGH